MATNEVDRAEWENPANWRGGWLRYYSSRRDSRVWVPKPNPAMGWTVNFARPLGVAVTVGVLAFAGVVVALAVSLAR